MTRDDIIKNISESFSKNYDKSEVELFHGDIDMPSRKDMISVICDFRELFFPLYFGDKELLKIKKEEYVSLLMNRIFNKLEPLIAASLPKNRKEESCDILTEFFKELPNVQEKVLKDVKAIFDGDPAAENKEEIILSYPGLFAIFIYRLAHELYLLKVPTLPRMMTEYAHSKTGIDINPGAKIGEYFMIDHGTGIVIGETARIGDNVQMYQGATLGALSPADGQTLRGKHRHPSVGNNVTIYANATLLGGDTEVGDNTIIGGNAFITHSIVEGSKVSVKAPELTISQEK